MFQRLIRVVVCTAISLLFNHLSVDKHLGCSPLYFIMNHIALGILKKILFYLCLGQVLLCWLWSPGCLSLLGSWNCRVHPTQHTRTSFPKDIDLGIYSGVESLGSTVALTPESCETAFQSDCSTHLPQKQCKRAPMTLHSLQYCHCLIVSFYTKSPSHSD